MGHTCYQKTDKGREEIATRKHGLSLRLRSVLLLIDGKRSGSELLTIYPGLGVSEAMLQELESKGFIAPVSEAPSVSRPGPQRTRSSGSRNRNGAKKSAGEKSMDSDSSLIMDTIFPPEMPLPREMLHEGGAMTMEDDHWKRHSPKALPDEYPTLFDAIKACYLDGLRDLPPATAAPFLRSLGSARNTRSLAELRPAYLRTLASTQGKAAAARRNEELDLLLFACAT